MKGDHSDTLWRQFSWFKFVAITTKLLKLEGEYSVFLRISTLFRWASPLCAIFEKVLPTLLQEIRVAMDCIPSSGSSVARCRMYVYFRGVTRYTTWSMAVMHATLSVELARQGGGVGGGGGVLHATLQFVSSYLSACFLYYVSNMSFTRSRVILPHP